MIGPNDEDKWAQQKEWDEERRLETSEEEEQSWEDARDEAADAKFDSWRDSR